MNIKESFTNSSSFTNSNTHTLTITITSTNTNTHTNHPLIEMQLCKSFADNRCQNIINKFWDFQVDYIQKVSPSTLPGGLCLPGRTPV